jgi:pyruvate/2-oxoglutarate dehydrogenase complex dihydrolipoamide acyltransferase (E2) component
MAVPLTVPRLGLDSNEAFMAEWYQPDGATVHTGEPVYCLEVDYIAVEVEAEQDGILRHRAEAGRPVPTGEVIAYILAPGERMPSEASRRKKKSPERPAPEKTESVEPRAKDEAPAAAPAYAFADMLGAGVDEATEPGARELPEGLPWDAFPATAREADSEDDFEELKPVLLFPRIVNALKAEAELAAEQDEEPEKAETIEPEEEPEPRLRSRRVSAWDLVPGESDFNPEWIMERRVPGETQEPARGSRFQASSIRNLALGRSGRDRVQRPAPETQPPAAEEDDEPADAAPVIPQQEAPREEAPAATQQDAVEPPALPEAIEPPARSQVVELPAVPAAEEPVEAMAQPEPPRVEELPPAVVAPLARVAAEPVAIRRVEPAAGPALSMRVSVNMNEALKMREQLTREWWGSKIRPTDEDIALRAISRALMDSSAFRRRTDAVGMQFLMGPTRGVHLLPDAATRPFRDAVASMAALRDTPGAEIPCVCTLTALAEFDLDRLSRPARGQPMAFYGLPSAT